MLGSWAKVGVTTTLNISIRGPRTVLFKSKKVIGLDIGTSSIKVAELDVGRTSATLKNFGIIATPPSGISGGDIVDIMSISDAIRDVISQAKIKTKSTACGLWGAGLIIKKISIPKMDKKLVAEQIRWEAEQYIPYDISEVNIDFQFLSTATDGPDSMDILLVAARKDLILKYMEIVEGAGQTCSILDSNGFALANCFEYNYGVFDSTYTALLNIGAYSVNFVVKYEKDMVFCRDIPVGGAMYTGEIQKAMNVSFSEAESLKLSSHHPDSVPQEVMQSVANTHEILCDEIKGSFEFFNNINPGASISRVFITGGACRTPGVLQALAESLQLECIVFDPLKRVKCAGGLGLNFKNQYGDFTSIAVGLGLRKLGDI